MKLTKSAILLAFILLLAACQKQPTAAPVAITPAAGQGAITGQLVSTPPAWKDKPLVAFAAPYLGEPDGKGVFILDGSLHPHADVAKGGAFQINNVPPGKYVLVFGPNAEEAFAWRDAAGNATIFDVAADSILEVGDVAISG